MGAAHPLGEELRENFPAEPVSEPALKGEGEKTRESSLSRREGRVSQAERLPSATWTDKKRPPHAD